MGVARTKFLAKVASTVSKPDGLLVVEPDGELDFLHLLPVQRLWGVGPVRAAGVLDAAWPLIEERGISLLGISVGNLAARGAVQLTLRGDPGTQLPMLAD